MSAGPYSMYGRTHSWLGSKWHEAADLDSRFTYCGLSLPLEVHDEKPPPPDLRCGQCEKIRREIDALAAPPAGRNET